MDTYKTRLNIKLKNGDQESFALLFEQYYKSIYSLAFRMCGNKEDAEDIMQKTFIQAYTNIGSFKEESSIYTWLYTIAKNLCLRHLEKKKKGLFSSLDELIHTVQSKEGLDSLAVVEKQQYIEQVKEGCLLGLLRCLSFYQRIAFILNVLLEVKVKDVAVIINKSETATRLLVHRGKSNIKNFLCTNCSLYDKKNPCHCENLIDFSIRQGWIQRISDNSFAPKSGSLVSVIENEINSLKKVTLLYKSMEERQPHEKILQLIRNEIGKPVYRIFFDKK